MIWRIIIGAGSGFLFFQLCAAIADASIFLNSMNFFHIQSLKLYMVSPIVVGALMGFAWHKLKTSPDHAPKI
jgi:hypothetical protein